MNVCAYAFNIPGGKQVSRICGEVVHAAVSLIKNRSSSYLTDSSTMSVHQTSVETPFDPVPTSSNKTRYMQTGQDTRSFHYSHPERHLPRIPLLLLILPTPPTSRPRARTFFVPRGLS